MITSKNALDSVKNGVVDIAMSSTGNFPKDFPLSLVATLPTLGFPGGVLKSYTEASAAFWEFYNKVPEIQAEFSDVKLLLPHIEDPYLLISKNKEVHYPADFKAMRIGGSGPKMDLVSANGGAKVQQAPPDTYMNLDKGITDGAFVTPGQVYDYKLQEIANYFYAQDFGCATVIVLMNKSSWNAMSPQDQQIMMETWPAANIESAQANVVDTQAGRKIISDAGKKITSPTPQETSAWAQSANEVAVSAWQNDAKGLNIPADVITKVISAWREIRSKHLP